MGLGELLDKVREQYVSNFIHKLEELSDSHKVIVEPAYRNSEGQIVTEGLLDVGARVDVAVVGESIEALNFDVEGMLSFEAFSFKWNNSLMVNLSPFQWDYVAVTFSNHLKDLVPVKQWFDKWFKENPIDGSELFDCVHYISDPEINNDDNTTTLYIDFGSARTSAFEEFLDAVSEIATEIYIGR